MPLMPMPPMPTKWIGPISLGNFMLGFPVSVWRRGCGSTLWAASVHFVAMSGTGCIATPPGQATSWHCCHPQDQVGKPLGRVGCALGTSGLGHCYELLRLAGKRTDLSREPSRREIVLPEAERAAGPLQHAGIGSLVLIQRVRQRHQDGGTSDCRKLGHGRGAGARNNEMARRHPRRQIGEEGRDFGLDLHPRVDLPDARHVLLA